MRILGFVALKVNFQVAFRGEAVPTYVALEWTFSCQTTNRNNGCELTFL